MSIKGRVSYPEGLGPSSSICTHRRFKFDIGLDVEDLHENCSAHYAK